MTEPRIELDKDPSAEEEAEVFASADERRQAQKNAHELKLRGRLGNLIGTNNTPLCLAAVMVAGLLFLLVMTFAFGFFRDLKENDMKVIERLISALLAVGAFIFGVNQRGK